MTRLNQATLTQLPAHVIRPKYERAALQNGVVHLGIGAFHRAHQAVYFDDLANLGDLRFGITAVSLRSAAVRDSLQSQDGLYTLVERQGSTEALRVVGVVRRVLVAPEAPEAVIAALAAQETRIVTLTITEKGYKLQRASGTLDFTDPDVAWDMQHPDQPRTAIGFLVAALSRVAARGLAPPVVLSCDNLPHNGQLLRAAVVDLAREKDAALAAWIEREVAFPCSMVDRIVPATTPADIERLAPALGLVDEGLVKTEPFKQWVIERCDDERLPDFASIGVGITLDVAAWERAKLRLLNAAHSAMAYLGGLAGLEYVHEFVASAERSALIERLWDEATETLTLPEGMDVHAYRGALFARFANSALQHRLLQIAMDGSQKLPQRLLESITWRLERGLSAETLTHAVAAWMRWCVGTDNQGRATVLDDPMAGVLKARLSAAFSAEERVGALLSISEIFPSPLAQHAVFRASLIRHFQQLERAAR